jgi:glycosyltransferase involved in cell wall biosynthesis
MKVYYDFIYPNEFDVEPGLYRNYFKYNKEDLLKYINPVFKKRNYTKDLPYLYKKIRNRYLYNKYKLPFSIYLDKDEIDLSHLFCSCGFYKSKIPWLTELETLDQLCGCWDYDAYNKVFLKNISEIINDDKLKCILTRCRVAKKSFELLNLPTDKIQVLYQTVTLGIKKIHKDKKDVKLLFNFGSNPLFHTKGGKEILDSFKVLKQKYPQISLTILGKDDNLQIKNINGVRYLGYIKHSDVVTYLTESDILIHPTHEDSLGYVILEAMSYGLPVVATKHYAIPEIIKHNTNGFLIDDISNVWYDENYIGKKNYRAIHLQDKVEYNGNEYNNIVENLINAIEPLILDYKLRQTFGDNNYNEVESGKHSVVRRNKQLISIYENALSQSAP